VSTSRLELGLKAFPTARTLLPADFIKQYGPRYSRECPRIVEHDVGPLSREFRYLVPFFERLAAEGGLPEQFLDVMRYDAAKYTLANDPAITEAIAEFERRALPATSNALLNGPVLRAPGVAVHAFTYAVIDTPQDPVQAPSLLVFHKQSSSRQVRVFRINALTGRFLELCDGQHTIEEAARLVAEANRGNRDDCVKLGLTLASRGVIGVMPNGQ
jgi:hypothetical protein